MGCVLSFRRMRAASFSVGKKSGMTVMDARTADRIGRVVAQENRTSTFLLTQERCREAPATPVLRPHKHATNRREPLRAALTCK